MTRRSFRSIALIVVAAIVPALVLGVFIGALAAADRGHATVPAAIVDQDRLVQAKQGGTTTTIAAGRLVVTNLTKPASASSGAAIDWKLASASQAKAMLADGSIYAIVTIPKTFSKSISSVSSTDPDRARITIQTDDAHGYIVSQLASSLGTSLTATLGSTISESVIKGLYSGYATLHDKLGEAASGATKIGTGTSSLAGGLGKLATGQDAIASGATGIGSGAAKLANGVDSLAGGAGRLASGLDTAADGAASGAAKGKRLVSGVKAYTGGVSSLAKGLRTTASSSAGLQQLPAGVAQYTAGVSSASSGLQQVLRDPSLSAADRAALQRISNGLTALSASGPGLVQGAKGAAALQSGVATIAKSAAPLGSSGAALSSGVSSVVGGYSSFASAFRQSASGASKLASGAATIGAGATALGTGADRLGSGAATIASGIRASQSGASKLASGADSLGSGLKTAASSLPDTTAAQRSRIADVVSNPVDASSTRHHETTSIGAIVASLIAPVSLWIGAAAAVLLFGAIRRRLLATGVSTGRLVGTSLLRGSVLAAVQAVLLVVLVQLTLHLDWGRALAVLGVGLVAGVAFFALHQFLTAVAGRAGTVISILLLGAQLVAVGGLYPIELVSEPFRVLSPYLPLTAAVGATQSIVTGAWGAPVGVGLATLVIWALIGFAATAIVVARRRASSALFAPPPVPAVG